ARPMPSGWTSCSWWCRPSRMAWALRFTTGYVGPHTDVTTVDRTMSRDTRPIGLFDSGLGGLTVVRALLDLVPDERLGYFGDTGRFPYGPKPADEVSKYAIEIADLLLERDVKMIVVACNS